MEITIEQLAQDLHDAATIAQKLCQTAAQSLNVRDTYKWHDITEPERERRRVQARLIADKYSIVPHDSIAK